MIVNVRRYMEGGGCIRLMNKISRTFTLMLQRFVSVHVLRQRGRNACEDYTYTDMYTFCAVRIMRHNSHIIAVTSHTQQRRDVKSFLLKNKSDSVQRTLPTCSN